MRSLILALAIVLALTRHRAVPIPAPVATCSLPPPLASGMCRVLEYIGADAVRWRCSYREAEWSCIANGNSKIGWGCECRSIVDIND